MLLFLLSFNAFSVSYTQGDFTYNIVNINRATLQSATCPSSEKELNIPDSVLYQNTNYPVTQIYQECFKDCANWVGSVNIPLSITSIGKSSFENCVGLNGELHLHDRISTIGARAFSGCSNLKFPNQDIISLPPITTINEYLFNGCSSLSANTFQLPPAITRINQFAFNQCSSLKGSLIIPDTVTQINANAFSGCSGFTSLRLPRSIATIGNFAFNGCSGFKGDLIFATTGRLSIGQSAFDGCTGLDGEITIYCTPNSIGNNAFSNLPNIKRINYYGSSFSNSGINVFEGSATNNIEFCSVFDNETFFGIDKTGATQLSDFSFSYDSVSKQATIKNGKCALLADNNAQIPTTTSYNSEQYIVVALDPFSFSFITEIIELSLPEGIQNIERGTFLGSSGFIGDLNLPNSITTIGDYAFVGTGFTGSLTLSSSLRQIGNNAFQSVQFTGTLKIPRTVESIGNYAFASCSKFDGNLVFEGASESSPSPSSFQSIGINAFYSCSRFIGDIILPDSISTIHENAFSGCLGFNGVLHLPNNLKVIENAAFTRCRNLQGDLRIPDGVVSIGTNAFSSCGFNGTLTIPNSVTTLGEGSFMSCSSLKGDLIIPEQITELPNQVFSGIGCDGLLKLPSNLKIIGDRSLQITKIQTELVIPPSVTYIGSAAFQRTLFNGNIIIPSNVTTIGLDAFSNCEGFNNIFSFGDNVVSLPERLFENTPIKTINYYGQNTVSECRPFNGLGVNVNVLTDYESNSFCSYNVNKVLELPNTDGSSSVNENEGTSNNDIDTTSNNENDETSNIQTQSNVVPPDPPEIVVTSNPNIEPPSESEPLITVEPYPIPTPVPENITVLDVPVGITSDALDNKLKEVLKDLSSDYIQIVAIDIPNIPFDSALEPNQFIKPASNAQIDFRGGNLNLVLNDNNNLVVLLNHDLDTNLSIKGQGDINIDFQPGLITSRTVNLTSNSQINGIVTLTVPATVDSVTIDSIELQSQSSILVKKKNNDEAVTLTVKDISATYNTVATISNLIVQNSLKAVQTATINVDNVTFDNAQIEYEIFNYEKGNNGWNNPLFKGKFNNPPNSLILRKAESINGKQWPTMDEEYILVSGLFELNKCNEWLTKINYHNSGFNMKGCINNEVVQEAVDQRIVIKTTENNNKIKNKLSTGQIVGIVIGCVAGVAIIVIIIIIVLRYKRRPKSENENEAADTQL